MTTRESQHLHKHVLTCVLRLTKPELEGLLEWLAEVQCPFTLLIVGHILPDGLVGIKLTFKTSREVAICGKLCTLLTDGSLPL